MEKNPVKIVSGESFIKEIAKEIEKLALGQGDAHIFRVGLSGGSWVNYLCQVLDLIDSDLSKWKLYFCDERFVPTSNPDSTYGAYISKLVPQKLRLEQFVPINSTLSLEECAMDYEQRILKDFGSERSQIPSFDLLLLGIGPDGHTCSLFPNHKLLEEQKRLIAPINDSPKPPPERVTMTLPLINNAKCCMFAMSGEGKADVVKRIFVEKDRLPAQLVDPSNGYLICFCDEAAGKYLLKQN